MSKKVPVAITGLGLVTPFGHSVEATWQSLLNGERAAKNQRPWLEEQLNEGGAGNYVPLLETSLLGVVENFNLSKHPDILASGKEIDAREVKRYYSTSAEYFVVAAIEAAKQAGLIERDLMLPEAMRDRSSVIVGTGAGGTSESPGLSISMSHGNKRLSPTAMSKNQPENAMIMASMVLRARGVNRTVTKACASSNAAFAQAAELIENGRTDRAIVGGTEGFSFLTLAEFESTSAASVTSDPEMACLPFRAVDAGDEGGTLVSSGAGVAVFERLDMAKARGAKILGIVAGYGETSDAKDMTMISGEGTERAMLLALSGDKSIREVRLLLSAHATGAGRKLALRKGDQAEALAIQRVFSGKKGRYKLGQIEENVVAIKERTLHSLGAANAVEFVINMSMMNSGLIIPGGPDVVMPEADGLVRTKHDVEEIDVDGFLSNGAGFGGSNASILVRKYNS